MKTRNIFFALVFIITSANLFGQVTFQRTYGTKQDDVADKFAQTKDKGFLLFGNHSSSSYDCIFKLDSAGNKLWSKYFTWTGNHFFPSGAEGNFTVTKDNGFLFYEGSFLIKTDSLGNLLWSHAYDSGYNGIAGIFKAIEVTGGYLLVGTSNNQYYPLLIKIDNSGNFVWGTNYGNGAWEMLDIIQLPLDSCYYLEKPASYHGDSATTKGREIIKLSKTGNLIWQKKYLAATDTFIYESYGTMKPSPAGNTIGISYGSLGYGNSFPSEAGYSWFSIDTSGAVMQSFTFPDSSAGSWFYSFTSSFDWDYGKSPNTLLFAWSQIMDTGTERNTDVALCETDLSGHVVWAKTIGGAKNENVCNFEQTTDKRIALLATTNSFGAGREDFYFIRADSSGNSGCNTRTFNMSNLTPIALTVSHASDSLSAYTVPVIASTVNFYSISDTLFDACVCHPPIAAFWVDNAYGIVRDSSQWANQWYWNFGDGKSDSGYYPKHRYVDTGYYNLCLYVKNNCGIDSVCQLIHVTRTDLGINNIVKDDKIEIWPNPSSGIYHLLSDEIISRIEVFDVTGRTVYTGMQRDKQVDVNLESISPGVYFMRIYFNAGTIVKRLLKI